MRAAEQNLSDRARTSLLIIGAFAIGQAIWVNNGVIHPAALRWLYLSMICLTAAMLPAVCKRLGAIIKINSNLILLGCIFIQLIELFFAARFSTTAIGCIALCGVGVILANRFPKWGLMLIVVGHFFAAAMMIESTPKPFIDVWYFQDESTAALLHGNDPYGVRFRDIEDPRNGYYSPGMSVDGWLTYSYPYPPLMLLMTAPGKIFGDVRWAHLVALELSAILIVAAVGMSFESILAAAMLLLNPRILLVIENAWTEPMVLLMLAAFVFSACKFEKWTWLALGLLFGIKQYAILATPLVFLIYPPREAVKIILRAGVFAAAVALPFFIWNPVSFFRSVILWQLRQPFRTDALSLAAVIDRTMNFRPGMWLCAICTIGAIWLVLRKSPRNVFGFVSALAFVLIIFFATNKQAFCNYYFLVAAVTCAAVAIGRRDEISHAGQIPLFKFLVRAAA